MPCQITFIINKGKLTTKTSWANNIKDIKLFRKFLHLLQDGEYTTDIVESIGRFANKSGDKETAKKLINHIIKSGGFENEPVVTPEDIGNEINFEE